jgi:hypothetical protein
VKGADEDDDLWVCGCWGFCEVLREGERKERAEAEEMQSFGEGEGERKERNKKKK